MSELGIVTKIEGASATVSITMGEGCAHCHSKGDCSVVGTELEVAVEKGSGISTGDMVRIELPKGASLAAVAWVAALPLALFAAGYLAGRLISPDGGEKLASLLGLAGMALGLAAAAVGVKRGRLGRKPVITRA